MKKLLKLFALIAASSCAAVTPAFAQSARQMTRSSLPGDSSLLVTSDTTATPGVFATRAISYAAFRSALNVTVRVTDTVRAVTFDSVKATTFYAGNGALATPSIAANNFRSTGWYWVAGPNLRASVNGTSVLSMTSTTVEPQVQIGGTFGSAATPAFGWGNDGMFRDGADEVSFATAGTERWSIVSNGAFVPQSGTMTIGTPSINADRTYASQHMAGNGSASLPSFTFVADSNTGMYRHGADTLAFSVGGNAMVRLFDNGIRTAFAGTASGVAYGFGTTNTTGFYNPGTANVAVATSGALAARWNAVQQTLGSATGVGAPAFSFDADTNTGIYRVGPDSLGVSANGRLSVVVRDSQFLAREGRVGRPGIAFLGDTLQGLYRVNSTTLGVAVNTDGIARFTNNGGNIQFLVGSLGSAGAPTISFASDPNTGIYSATDNLAVATAGVVRTFTSATEFQVSGSSGVRFPEGTGATPGWYFNNDQDTGVGFGNASTNAEDSLKLHVNSEMALILKQDTLIVPDKARASALTAASGTPNSVCIDATSKQILENAATSCVVSSRRFKKDIRPLSYSQASYITRNLQPSTFTYRQGERKAIGLIAEQADSVDSRLTTRDGQGRINSVNYEQVTVVLLRQVQELQARLDRMCKAGVTSAC